MPRVLSRSFGIVDYVAGEEFVFPTGLPGFSLETAFLPVEVPEQLPLVYLQSMRTPELCFVALPANCIVAGYLVSANPEDLETIRVNQDEPDGIHPGPETLCLALLCFSEDGTVTANLRAPLVVNLKSRIGVQMIQNDDRYPIRFLLETGEEVSVCS
jgi:flagellar assembly factor FliW